MELKDKLGKFITIHKNINNEHSAILVDESNKESLVYIVIEKYKGHQGNWFFKLSVELKDGSQHISHALIVFCTESSAEEITNYFFYHIEESFEAITKKSPTNQG